MSTSPRNALVPVHNTLPARRPRGLQAADPAGVYKRGNDTQAFDLVSKETSLRDRDQVERYLPDILGRALARSWIDADFREAFVTNPLHTLARHRIRLPPFIRIEVVVEGQTRPMVVVSEEGMHGGPARRLLYLQLVMVAGK
jgi:hypothetical protein